VVHGRRYGARLAVGSGGFFQAIAGVVALVNDQFYVVGEEWVFQFDTTTWAGST
jgi:hypothetical protein